MKNVVFVFVLFFTFIISAQQKVVHTSGSQTVNGIDVSVSKSEATSTYTSNCSCESIGPFWAGGATSDGSYLFGFTPPVSEIRLDFDLINGDNLSGIEEVQVFVNGIHFPIGTPGTLLDCSLITEHTSEGNLTGSNNSESYGSVDTRIYDVIYSVRVYNKQISGQPYGSVFSLYVGDEADDTDVIDFEKENQDVNIISNAQLKTIVIETNNRVEEVILLNIKGQRILYSKNTVLSTEALSAGLYFVKVKTINSEIVKKVFVN